MHLQVLASGSQGNSTLVRVAESHLLVDAGLQIGELRARLESVRVAPLRIDHVVLSHGHLDHARSAGILAKRSRARLHCAERLMTSRAVRRAPLLSRLTIGATHELAVRGSNAPLLLRAVRIPHDAEPTVALRLEHEGRVAVVLTDMGEPDRGVAGALSDAHVLVLEFNHDLGLLRAGPYSDALKRRIAGPRGHLSNDEAARMLLWMAGPHLHTLVLAHLSETNNAAAIAQETALRTLQLLGRPDVQVLIAAQHAPGASLRV
jgi:phosphoribosyl 1,2-cyclic phosphodiesterase